ncbi:SAM and SH3 domain-containing protein 3 isoform X2 [Nerophis ophidion]|uniref:SAM and SH3 domain-containing protein 3 isoform X2 n=1 Tax=Nerophis ophidion TaxID=159077 RepID=UPI002ADF8971|nr:SAM and SH3 domain-containing protein 3 isoform X2 [Nerophis ophidion]
MLRRRPSNASEKDQAQKKKVEDGVADGGKSGSRLGKTWRNVMSRTMTRKTSKMVQKVLSEDGGGSSEEVSTFQPGWLPSGTSPGQRTSLCSTGSEDTVPSPLSCPFSGNSDRQSLDSGYCQRDSLRLEDSAYNGPFCGRALVHTDFMPSPYDVESLKLQKGDVIHIIEKPPAGTWTGKLNNKVGSFKFIYVNLLPDDSPPARRRPCSRKISRTKSRPSTLDEVLDSIGLLELTSLLSMHGFQSLEDFSGLRESHLNELNITDPDQRSKILTAIDQLRESEEECSPEEQEDDNEEVEKEEDRSMGDAKDTRDSGCFESSEHLEVGGEETKPEDEDETKAGDEETHLEDEETDKETHLEDEETDKETHLEDEETDKETHLEDEETHLEDEETHLEDEETDKETHLEDEETDKETHLEDEETHLEDEETHLEEEETHLEDKETHLEDEETHLEDEETHLEDEETHLEDKETHLEDEETHLEDEETHLEDEETHLEDKETHLEDEETHLEDEETHLEDEETHLEDEETHLEDEETDKETEEELQGEEAEAKGEESPSEALDDARQDLQELSVQEDGS